MTTFVLKTICRCATCGKKLQRQKKIKTIANLGKGAVREAAPTVEKWHDSLQGQNCKVCQSIIDSVEADKK